MAQALETIPNNVDLSSDRRLQRALEQWQPNFLSWWNEVGPEGFQAHQIYLRTAISVETEPDGWQVTLTKPLVSPRRNKATNQLSWRARKVAVAVVRW